jgi:thiosulfate/3-mercaptopyruvate sulfurtransferase
VREHITQSGTALVDVRSPQEFSGEKALLPEYPQEGTLRTGHIPTAANIPWAKAVNEDSTFKSVEELRALYAAQGVSEDKVEGRSVELT